MDNNFIIQQFCGFFLLTVLAFCAEPQKPLLLPMPGKITTLPPREKSTADNTPVTSNRKMPVTISVVDAQGRPASGIIHLVDSRGKFVAADGGGNGFLVDGSIQINLRSGAYSLTYNGGLRVMPQATIINVSSKGDNKVTISSFDYAPVAGAGWRMMDVFYDLNYALDSTYKVNTLEKLVTAAKATGVDILACNGLWNMKNAGGEKFAVAKGGEQQLKVSLDAARSDGVLVLSCWSCQRPALGRFYALEAVPVPSPQIYVGNSSFVDGMVRIRDRNGIVALAHPGGLAGERQVATELPFATIAGPLYDLVDISRGGKDISIWFNLLNLGYRIPAIGGGVSTSNLDEVYDLPKAGIYLKIPRKTFMPQMVVNTLKAGRSVISNGPFLRFYIQTLKPSEDKSSKGILTVIGDSIYPSALRRKVWLDAYSCSDPQDWVKKVELIYNGNVIETAYGKPDQKTLQVLWANVVLDKTGWILVRYTSNNERLWAITNPVYVSDSNSTQPLPVSAGVRIVAIDAVTGVNLPANFSAVNFGVRLGTWPTGNSLVQLPATAEILVTAAGYKPMSLNLYRESGGWQHIERMRADKSLSRNLESPALYKKIEQMLSDFTIKARLQKR